jgi:hypothetical protein
MLQLAENTTVGFVKHILLHGTRLLRNWIAHLAMNQTNFIIRCVAACITLLCHAICRNRGNVLMTTLATHLSLGKQVPGYASHEVMNQPGSLEACDLFSDDKPLCDAVHVFGADWADDHLKQTGVLVGSAKVQHLARQANRHLPELRTHDRFGHRIDVVEFHPVYHELMGLIFGCQAHSFAWTHDRPGAHVARAALSYLWNQGENGICCPMGMTFASIPALQARRRCLQNGVP